MPGPGVPSEFPVQILRPQRFAKCQDPIEIIQETGRAFPDKAMMRIVQQENELAAAASLAQCVKQSGIVPFMDQHQARIVERCFEIKFIQLVKRAFQVWESGLKIVERRIAVFGFQVAKAPTVGRFEDAHVMTPALELGDDSSEKMGVAVVPVR